MFVHMYIGAVLFMTVKKASNTSTNIIAEEHVDINGFVHTGMMEQPCRASDHKSAR